MLRSRFRRWYLRHLERTIESLPDHIAVIQDGNRRYANAQGTDRATGYEAGAQTTQQLLEWALDFDIRELTLYAFSTENFDRSAEERALLFDLITDNLRELAEDPRIHEHGVRIQAIGRRDRLPQRVLDAIEYAESETAPYTQFQLNIAVAYGGRATLLSGARAIAHAVDDDRLDPTAIDVSTVEQHLYETPVRDVDLLIRTGGEQRTSNFLPWHANGHEAAVYFCTPYWPSFSKLDFLRALRAYERQQQSWRQSRVTRALALLQAMGNIELPEARSTLHRFQDAVPDPVPVQPDRDDPEPSSD